MRDLLIAQQVRRIDELEREGEAVAGGTASQIIAKIVKMRAIGIVRKSDACRERRAWRAGRLAGMRIARFTHNDVPQYAFVQTDKNDGKDYLWP